MRVEATEPTTSIVEQLRPPEGQVGGPSIVTELRRALVSGAVRPGSPIPVDEVAKVFGVSRIPVREALKNLQGEGLLEHRPRMGYTVTSLTSDELAELYLVRGALEGAALSAAATRATEADRERARAALHGQGSDADPATETFQRSSRHFHEALLAPCRMPRLLHMVDIAWNLTEPVQTMMRVTDGERAALELDHVELLEAFLDRDVDRLQRLATEHHQRLTQAISRIPIDDPE